MVDNGRLIPHAPYRLVLVLGRAVGMRGAIRCMWRARRQQRRLRVYWYTMPREINVTQSKEARIRNARIKIVGKYQPCMNSTSRIHNARVQFVGKYQPCVNSTSRPLMQTHRTSSSSGNSGSTSGPRSRAFPYHRQCAHLKCR